MRLWDTVGTDEAIDVSLELVADRSRIVTIAAFARGLELGIKVIGGAPGADPGTEIRQAARLELVQLARARHLRVIVSQTFPLTEVAAAHRAAMTGHARGKIALTVLARGGDPPEPPACAPRPRGGTSPIHRPLAGAFGPGSLGR